MDEKIEFISGSDIHRFFTEERKKVVRYLMGRYGLDESIAEDCFQEGSAALWQNIRSGKLTRENLTCSLSTYLMRCCCNHATHEYEKKMKLVTADDLFINNAMDKPEERDEHIEIEDKQLQLLADTIRNLPEPCNTILWNIYFNYHEVEKTLKGKEKIMDAVAMMIGYKKTSLKAKKTQCMTKLKTKINSLLNA